MTLGRSLNLLLRWGQTPHAVYAYRRRMDCCKVLGPSTSPFVRTAAARQGWRLEKPARRPRPCPAALICFLGGGLVRTVRRVLDAARAAQTLRHLRVAHARSGRCACDRQRRCHEHAWRCATLQERTGRFGGASFHLCMQLLRLRVVVSARVTQASAPMHIRTRALSTAGARLKDMRPSSAPGLGSSSMMTVLRRAGLTR